MRKWLWTHSLALILLAAFLVFVTAQAIAGWQVRNEELAQAGAADHATAESPPRSRRRGWRSLWYRNSLSLVLFAFFGLSFTGNLAGAAAYNEEQALQSGAPPLSMWQYARSAQFWFESKQNWQSEFIAVAALVLLSIVLRQHGSPQSKPVTAPDPKTRAE
ncbi:MAG TPA: DUF6766 family protein [Candidatus Limnocylindrales bacterium]|nr:DUF6766 family protein [Candidatus Limnocylindrales bacterium]